MGIFTGNIVLSFISCSSASLDRLLQGKKEFERPPIDAGAGRHVRTFIYVTVSAIFLPPKFSGFLIFNTAQIIWLTAGKIQFSGSQEKKGFLDL